LFQESEKLEVKNLEYSWPACQNAYSVKTSFQMRKPDSLERENGD